MHTVVLKPHKEKALHHRHPWIFSGAIHSFPDFEDGDVLAVVSSKGDFLGYGYFSRRSQIVGRMLSFDRMDPYTSMKQSLQNAYELRKRVIVPSYTNAYRLVNAEADLLPGLIVDVYGNSLVMQIGTLGMEKLQPFFIEQLCELLKPQWIYEKSTSASRKEEGLQPIERTVYGKSREVEVFEGDIRLSVSLEKGQKTGYFLDQRGMREYLYTQAKDKQVLNCFSYTGAFSLQALAGGAAFCTSVDISKEAIAQCELLMKLNGFKKERHTEIAQDAFIYLRENLLPFDIVILDPPAFAKKKHDVQRALAGYKEINRLAMQKMPSHSMLITCSCSYYIDQLLFEKMLFRAACDAKRDVKIIQKHRLASDHPVSLFYPEGNYLKSAVCYVI